MRKIQQLCTSMLLTLALMVNMVPAGLAAEEPDRDLSLEPEYTDLSAADAPGAENPITDFETLQAAVETAEGTAEEPAVIYISGMMEQTAQLALEDGQYIHLVGVGAGENGLVRAESFTNNGDMIDVGRNDNSNVCGLTLENIVLDGGAQWADAAGGTNDGISAGNSSLLSVRGSAEAYLLDGTTLRNNEKSGGGAGVWIVGELYVDGGEIVDNAAAGTNRGGAAYLRNPESVLNLLSGEISNNYAAVGGGVYINNQGTVNLGGGSIAGNEIPSGDSNLDVNNGSVQITGAFETGDQVGLTLPELKNGAVAASRADGCDPEVFAAAAQALTLDGSPDYQLSVQGDEIVLSDNTTGCGCPEGFIKGNGTEESPYCVSNEQQLRHVAEHPDACICLEDDIVLTGEWTPFAFQGSLDGQGCSISGLQVTAGAAGGLFSAVDAGGRICDLTVSGSLTVGRGMTMAGGIAAELNGDVENVTSDVDITVTEEASEAAMVGGVAGRSTGTVVDSTYSGVIDDQRSSNDGYLGAIIGRADIEAPEGMPAMITAHAGFAAPGGPSDTSEDNTIDNIIKAVNYGPDAIEVDVQSADSDNDGVREMWLGHDGVDYEKNPTLEETLRLLMGEHPRSDELNENGATVRIQLDSKEDGNLGKILDVIHEVGFPVDRVILAGDNSYDHVLETIDEIREAVEEGMDFWMNPNFIIGTGWEGYSIMINDTDRFLEQIRNLNLPVFTVNSSYQFMSDELIQRFREEGINVSLWTLNDTETIQDNFLRGVYNTTSRLLEILEYRDLLTTGVSGNTFDGSLPQVGSEKTEEEPGEGGGGGGCGCPEGFTKGNGTEESPYCVSNEQQLRHVAEHPDACICLEDDIVLTGEWTPFAFQGSLDGQGCSISGLQVTAGAAGGLFSAVDAGGRICDLTVSGSLTVGRGMTMAGGIAAELNGDVENVTSDVDITVTEEASEAAMVGGVAGRSTGTVVDSTYSGVIDDQRSSNDGYLGAIIGRADIEAPEGMPAMITAHAGFAAPGGPSDTSEDNTIDNIIKAVNYGPDAIEVDVQSADSDNDGVREMWLGHDGVDYEKNPTLEETLRLLMGEHPRSDELNENGATVRIQLDSKEDGNLGKILDVIHEVGFPVDRVILAGDNSYDHVLETIDEIREAVEEGMDFWMNPNFIIGTGWEGYSIMINDTDRFLEQIRNLNLPVFTVNSSYQFMSDELIQRFREEGINVSLWTLNDTETIQDNFLRGVYNTTSRLLEILEYRDLLTTGVSGNTFDGSLPQVGSEKTEEEPGEGGGGGSGSSGGSDPVYSPALDVSSGGSVQVSPRNPSEDDEVTIRVDPDSGYEVGTVTVTDRNGREVDVTAEGGNTYTFLQPQGRVTISVTFVRESGSTFFADVPEAFWAYDEIKWAYDNGYVNGTSANTFSPNASISRQQVWMILARLSGTAPADMAAARSWAVANGISDGTNPGSAVTRQQLVALLYRYAQMMGSDNGQREDLAGFPDAGTVSAYAVEPMQWSVANGIVAGTSQGTLNPAGTATRAQFAAILYRFANQAG